MIFRELFEPLHIFLSKSTVHEEVEFTVNEFAKNLEHYAYLAEDYHVYPDFHGNRSPIADASLKGMVGEVIYQFIKKRLLVEKILTTI